MDIKKNLIKFDLWWRNAYVLHFLSCFFIVSPFIVGFKLGLISSILLSTSLGFGKETFDKFVKKGPFEVFKAFITMIGGLLFYFIYTYG